MKRWTNEDIEFLKDNYNSMKTKEIAIKLNRTTQAIYRMSNRLKLIKKNLDVPKEFGHCSKCDSILPAEKFYKHHIGKYCIECTKKYSNERYRAKREEQHG